MRSVSLTEHPPRTYTSSPGATISNYEGNKTYSPARIPLRKRMVWIFDTEELLIYSILYFAAAAIWFGLKWVAINAKCTTFGRDLDASTAPVCADTGTVAIATQSIFGWFVILGLFLLVKILIEFWQAWGPRAR